MTTSMESHHSCAEDEEPEENVTTYLDEPRDTFDSAMRPELDALPSGTSLTELKSAALEVSLFLILVHSTESSPHMISTMAIFVF